MQKKPNVSAKKLMLKKEILSKLDTANLSSLKGGNGLTYRKFTFFCNTREERCGL